MKVFRNLLPAALVAALCAIAGTALAADNSIKVAPQPAGNTVTIPMVTIAHNGFLVIHDSNAMGKIVVPQSIGHVAITAGTHKNVMVKLDHPVKAGKKLYAMLHEDTGKPGVYRFAASGGKVDVPTMQDGKPVIVPFMIK